MRCVLTTAFGVPVEPELMELLEVALRAAELTDGLVDPTVGGALIALGYDRDIAELVDGVDGTPGPGSPVPW